MKSRRTCSHCAIEVWLILKLRRINRLRWLWEGHWWVLLLYSMTVLWRIDIVCPLVHIYIWFVAKVQKSICCYQTLSVLLHQLLLFVDAINHSNTSECLRNCLWRLSRWWGLVGASFGENASNGHSPGEILISHEVTTMTNIPIHKRMVTLTGWYTISGWTCQSVSRYAIRILPDCRRQLERISKRFLIES